MQTEAYYAFTMTNTNETKLAALNVLRYEGSYYVAELTSDYKSTYSPDAEILFHRPMYPEVETPEIESPTTSKKMWSALYDLVQCEDRIADGAVFVTPHGVYRVEGVHVSQVLETANQAKARRARIRRMEVAFKAQVTAKIAAKEAR